MPKKITIEQLARMTQEEFGAVRKEMHDGFKRMDDGFKAVASILDLMRADIRDIKITLPPLIRSQAVLEREVGDLQNRVARLERRAGMPR